MSTKTIMFFVLFIASIELALFANLRTQDTDMIDETLSTISKVDANVDVDVNGVSQKNERVEEILDEEDVTTPIDSSFIQEKDFEFIDNIDASAYSDDDQAEEDNEDKLVETDSEVDEAEGEADVEAEGEADEETEAEETNSEEATESDPVKETKQNKSALRTVSDDLLELVDLNTITDTETDSDAEAETTDKTQEMDEEKAEEKTVKPITFPEIKPIVFVQHDTVETNTNTKVEDKVEDKTIAKADGLLQLLKDEAEIATPVTDKEAN
jgi:hypothetical protein